MAMTSAPRVNGLVQESGKGATNVKMNIVCTHSHGFSSQLTRIGVVAYRINLNTNIEAITVQTAKN